MSIVPFSEAISSFCQAVLSRQSIPAFPRSLAAPPEADARPAAVYPTFLASGFLLHDLLFNLSADLYRGRLEFRPSPCCSPSSAARAPERSPADRPGAVPAVGAGGLEPGLARRRLRPPPCLADVGPRMKGRSTSRVTGPVVRRLVIPPRGPGGRGPDRRRRRQPLSGRREGSGTAGTRDRVVDASRDLAARLPRTAPSLLSLRVEGNRPCRRLDAGPLVVLLVGQAEGSRDEPDLVILVDGFRLPRRLEEAAEAPGLGDGRAALRPDRAPRLHDISFVPSPPLPGTEMTARRRIRSRSSCSSTRLSS